jgi:hypothetical protein
MSNTHSTTATPSMTSNGRIHFMSARPIRATCHLGSALVSTFQESSDKASQALYSPLGLGASAA